MTYDTFEKSTATDRPPEDLSAALRGLWYDACGDWDRAHREVQDDEGADAAWVHAYLHRKEGDLANAGYWYRRAGERVPDQPLEEEWKAIARTLLDRKMGS